jgi:hypothetical protein
LRHLQEKITATVRGKKGIRNASQEKQEPSAAIRGRAA